MRIAPTATELTILRCSKQWTHIYVGVHRPATLFSARLSAAPASYPAATLAFASGTPTTGTIPAGTTVYIGSSSGARDKGTLRLRNALTAAASGTMSVAELGDKYVDFATNDYLTIVEDYRPAAKFPRYSAGVWYMDYDIAYGEGTTIENDQYGPLARLGPPAAGFLVGDTCRLKYVGERSAAYSPSNAVDTWAWEFPDGSNSSSEGTTASPIAVDYVAAVSGGRYHSLTVTEDTTNKTHTGRRLTFVFERSGANAPYDAVIVGKIQGGPGQGGYSTELKIINTAASQTDFPDGAHVVVFQEAYYADDSGPWYATDQITGSWSNADPVVGATSGAVGSVVATATGYIHLAVTSGEFQPGEIITIGDPSTGTAVIYAPNIGGNFPYRSNVLLEGWITGETVRKNPATGEINFSVTTLDGVLRTIEGYPVALTNRSQATPTISWEDAHLLTANMATLHFVRWRSTIADICDVEFQAYAAPQTAIVKYVTLDKSSLFDQINSFWQSGLLGWVACDLQGALYCEMDAVIDETVRANLVSLFTISKETDLFDELEIERHTIADNSQTVLYAVAYKKPLGSKSPGDPHGYEGQTAEITDGVIGPLIDGDNGQPDSATLSTWAGNLRAKANNAYRNIVHRLFGNWRIDPVPQSYFTETISSGDTLRGFSLTAVKMIPRELVLLYNERSYSLLAEVTADRETTGLGGVAIEFPPVENPPIEEPPIGDDPPITPPDVLANAREKWVFEQNGVYWSEDFFNGGQPTWDKVAALPDTGFTHGFIALDGSAVYLARARTNENYGIYKCANPKSASPVWTDILSGESALGYTLVWSGQYNFGLFETKPWAVLGLQGYSNPFQYNAYGEFSGAAWTFTYQAWISYSWIHPTTYRCGNTSEKYYRMPEGTLLYTPPLVSPNSALGQMASFRSGAAVSLYKDLTTGLTYIALPNSGSLGAALDTSFGDVDALVRARVMTSYDGSLIFVINTTSGAHEGEVWAGDASEMLLLTQWASALKMEDAARLGGGQLVLTKSTAEQSNEFIRINRDGTGTTWEAMTGNFWDLASGTQTFINSCMVF